MLLPRTVGARPNPPVAVNSLKGAKCASSSCARIELQARACRPDVGVIALGEVETAPQRDAARGRGHDGRRSRCAGDARNQREGPRGRQPARRCRSAGGPRRRRRLGRSAPRSEAAAWRGSARWGPRGRRSGAVNRRHRQGRPGRSGGGTAPGQPSGAGGRGRASERQQSAPPTSRAAKARPSGRMGAGR